MKTFLRYAWAIILVLGLFELTFGVTLLILGPAGVPNVIEEIRGVPWTDVAAESDEAGLIDYLARGWGQANIQYGIAMVAIAAFPFRRRERWSWFVVWLVPATLLVTVIRNLALGVTSVVIIDLSEAIIVAAVLLLAYRNFVGERAPE